MPTYQYACTECGHQLEAVQSFSDPALTECPNCHGKLRKVFNSVGIVFKGSGFYRNDSRAGGVSAEKPSTNGSDAPKKSDTPSPSTSSSDSSASSSSSSSSSGASSSGGKSSGGTSSGSSSSGSSSSGGAKATTAS
ncbi:FmdB family zinc ribbon protein [Paractinoplanes toevensis]|uniref:FmdB family zinc ribbon protein n=1 Tax=Paractinoplanes toevensis TaxID=571911 RepID=UPI001BB30917|nr:FmdB family zinc ribbon protein [Actinoplanes toevensis]